MRLSPVLAACLTCVVSACGETKSGNGSESIPIVVSEEPLERRTTDPNTLEYTLRFEEAHKHLFDVEMSVASAGKQSLELILATWTPGSYLIREYARHLEGLRAMGPDGAELAITKVRKNRWRVDTGGAANVSIRYRIYGREMSVRTNFVDDEVAMVVGAATFLTVDGRQKAPHDVTIAIRPGWSKVATGLDAHPNGDANRFVARDFDELVDSPFLIGNPVETRFEEGGAEHIISSFAASKTWDADKANKDVQKIVREQQAFWGEIPYKRYVILNAMLSQGGQGGLEHLDNTLLLANRHTMAKPSRYRGWLGLVSHEVFHTWNGKRLRPIELGPFDYENEVHTPDLWIVEGLTSYYDDLMLRRTGLYTEKQYFEALGGQISSIQRTPGRLVQPLSRSSFDAWIKYYRRDENSSNSSVSYYTKGAVVGFLLDMKIRAATAGRKSLDDLMRAAYRQYGGDTGYRPAEFRALASEVAGIDLSSFFERAVDSTKELEYDEALAYVGLRFKPVEDKTAKKDEDAYLGASLSSSDVITRVPRASPAFDAGLNVGDEIIAIDGERLPSDGISSALERHKTGDEVEVLLARRGAMRTIRVKLGAPPAKAFELEKDPNRSAAQAARAADWLAPVAK